MRKVGLVIVAALTALAGTSTALAARGGNHGAHSKHAGSVCTGELASGTYRKLVVPAGAFCNGVDATIHVRGGLRIRAGATFVLGSDERNDSTGTISGGVRATNAASVQIHLATIKGGLRVRGGSGPGTEQNPNFNAIEDNHIKGGATVKDYNGFWFGFIRNHVRGTVKLNDNVLVDPDANEYVTNTIKGSLVCHGNSPAPQVGDSEGQPNVVSGQKVGQCAGL